MEWRGEGIVLSTRRHGETSVIIDVFTEDRGRTAGVVRGGTSRRMTPVLQPGNQVDVSWRARLEEHLGTFTVEPLRTRTVQAMSDRLSLAGLSAVTSLICYALPERDPAPQLYRLTESLLDLLGQGDFWALGYLRFEMALLETVGLGLDLTECAVTGFTDELIYVSPKSGRAVSKAGAGIWADRLLPLPPCLLGEGPAPDNELQDAFRTTGYFLEEKLSKELGGKPLPEARGRFVDLLGRKR